MTGNPRNYQNLGIVSPRLASTRRHRDSRQDHRRAHFLIGESLYYNRQAGVLVFFFFYERENNLCINKGTEMLGPACLSRSTSLGGASLLARTTRHRGGRLHAATCAASPFAVADKLRGTNIFVVRPRTSAGLKFAHFTCEVVCILVSTHFLFYIFVSQSSLAIHLSAPSSAHHSCRLTAQNE